MIRLTWIVVVALASGCASKQYYRYQYESSSLPKPSRRVLLHPTMLRNNVSSPPQAKLQALDDALAARFLTAGHSVDTSSTSLARLRTVRSFMDKPGQRPAETSLAALGEDDVCDLVVFPVIERRRCEAKNGQCIWDGVIRDVDTDSGFGLLDGHLQAFSVAIYAYGCAGTYVFHSKGGLEPAVALTTEVGMGQTNASPTSGTDTYSVRFQQNRRYLDRPEVVTEAIGLALHPLIAMDGYPKKPKFHDPLKELMRRGRRAPKRKADRDIFRSRSTR
ncbi:MAG: hypothetical protein RIT81_26980 [Deltaproteobacteria bacterium]